MQGGGSKKIKTTKKEKSDKDKELTDEKKHEKECTEDRSKKIKAAEKCMSKMRGDLAAVGVTEAQVEKKACWGETAAKYLQEKTDEQLAAVESLQKTLNEVQTSTVVVPKKGDDQGVKAWNEALTKLHEEQEALEKSYKAFVTNVLGDFQRL